MIEILETRIAPAAVFTFTDVDGDLVTIKISKGDATQAVLSTSLVGPLGGVSLDELDLQGNSVFKGASITITAKPQDVDADGRPDGDGLVNVRFIDATGIDLGAVKVSGTLTRIVAGDADLATPGLASLTATTVGRTDFGAIDSDIQGKLGALKVNAFFASITAGSIGSITLGSFNGSISAGAIGTVKIASDFLGAIESTGGGGIGATTIGGGFRGTLSSAGPLGALKVGGDVALGAISSQGKMASVTIGGSLGIGRFGITISTGGSADMGPVKIGGDIRGSDASVAGVLAAGGKLASVKVGGSLIGGVTALGAQIVSGTGIAAGAPGGDMGPVTIGGDIRAGDGAETGKIVAGGNLAKVTIGGSIIGGDGAQNTQAFQGGIAEGQIYAAGSMGAVKVGGDLKGGAGDSSAQIRSVKSMGSVSVGGAILGGTGLGSGAIVTIQSMGAVKIGRDVMGGDGVLSGRIYADKAIASVAVGGSVIGGFKTGAGTIVAQSGEIKKLTIGGNLEGGRALSNNVDKAGYVEAGRIGSLMIGGSIVGGFQTGAFTGSNLASIRVFHDIGTLTVRGDLLGSGGSAPKVVISARGIEDLAGTTRADVAIGKINIGGGVANALFLAGYLPNGSAVNADAQIGSVTVGRDWVSSSLVAGVTDGGDGIFGNGNDGKIADTGQPQFKDVSESAPGGISRIASLQIRGRALGDGDDTAATTWAVMAQQFGSIKVGGAPKKLLNGPSNDSIVLAPSLASGTSFDFRAIEA